MALSASGPSERDLAKAYLPRLLEDGSPDKIPKQFQQITIDYALELLADDDFGFWWFWLNLAWIRVKGKTGWTRACPDGVPRVHPNGRDWSWQVEVAKLLSGMYEQLLILKARQIGFSYLLANLIVWIAIRTETGVGVAVIANKTQSAKRLMRRSLQTYNRLPRWLKDARPMVNPAISRMEWANGSVVEPYSGDPDAARSDDATWVIVDEVGEIELLDDFYASIESIADDGGHLIMCGTAKNNGLEHYVKDCAEGEIVASAVVPTDDGDMRLPVTLGENGIHFLFMPDRVHPSRTVEWREKKVKSFKGNMRNFEREHPQTWQEAFIAQGGGFFDARALVKVVDSTRALFEARDVRGTLMAAAGNPKDVRFFEDAYGHVVRHATNEEFDALMLECRPSAIGVDSAGDRPEGDYHAASGLLKGNVPDDPRGFDPDTLVKHVQLFTIHGHFDADQYAEQCVNLGYLLGTAVMGIETNGLGVQVLKTVRRLRYPNIYRRRTSDKKRGSEVTEEYGWWSNNETKSVAYGELERCLRNGYTDIRDYYTLLEMGNVLMLGGGKLGARPPKHDDRPDGLGIAHAIIGKAYRFDGGAVSEEEKDAPYGSLAWLEKILDEKHARTHAKDVIGNENHSILNV